MADTTNTIDLSQYKLTKGEADWQNKYNALLDAIGLSFWQHPRQASNMVQVTHQIVDGNLETSMYRLRARHGLG